MDTVALSACVIVAQVVMMGVAIGLLDGVAAGLFSVISVIIAADLTRGTGRFNLAQGLVALSVGIGAGLSNLTAGFVVQWFSYPIGFLYLAGIAVCGLMFFATMMPETRPANDPGGADGHKHSSPARLAATT
jgi:MFS family permease